jgi:hydrogenase maturation protein HypF
VYRLAERFDLTGWVRNDGDGVVIDVQGKYLEVFLDALRGECPRLASIDDIELSDLAPTEYSSFVVVPSGRGKVTTVITADYPVCDDCVRELFDANDRRHLYPFINCTNCGPRYTLTHRLPYDRVNTSMARFAMCRQCAGEYQNPTDRRFHAEPIACPTCGPLLDTEIAEIVSRLGAGEIVAVKGLGGFHLACDARNVTGVDRLRRLKQRDNKPFAVMLANLASTRRLVELDGCAAALLQHPARPIVLAHRRGAQLPAAVAPDVPWLGVMLPYTPLHHLLFYHAAGCPRDNQWLTEAQDLVLVMTSANPGGEPLVIGNAEACQRLAGIADHIVTHDRDIVIRADDSVMRVIDGAPAFLRRARGFVPESIRLARPAPPILAVGAYLKSTVCVTRGHEAFVSQHIGDLDNAPAIRFFEESVHHLLDILQVEPCVVAHDLHPDFPSTRFALDLGIATVAVQHHHAHVAAVIAEHRVKEPCLGVALDGFGLGPDAESWGGELLWVHGAQWQRVGHLKPLPQPGGDIAARQPWRMGAAALHELGRGAEISSRYRDQAGAAVLAQMLDKNINTPLSSSCGRLFDAACGLLGVVPHAGFEGHAPMVLEGLVSQSTTIQEGWRLANGVLDLLPLLERLIDQDAQHGAELFHGTLIGALTAWIEMAATDTGCRVIALSGGCFLNQVLSAGLSKSLRHIGLKPLLPRRLPPNDGAISLGQAWVAAQTPGLAG